MKEIIMEQKFQQTQKQAVDRDAVNFGKCKFGFLQRAFVPYLKDEVFNGADLLELEEIAEEFATMSMRILTAPEKPSQDKGIDWPASEEPDMDIPPIARRGTIMDIKEIKEEFGDCDRMRGGLNDYTIDAVRWLIRTVEEHEEVKMDNKKKLKVLKMIADDMKNDAKNFDGQPFNGKTVARYFGNQGAAIAALANIMQSIIGKA